MPPLILQIKTWGSVKLGISSVKPCTITSPRYNYRADATATTFTAAACWDCGRVFEPLLFAALASLLKIAPGFLIISFNNSILPLTL